MNYYHTLISTSLGVARNLALKKAKGDYISFLDYDDLYLPEKTLIQVSSMQKYNAILSYGSWIKINDCDDDLRIFKTRQYFGQMFESLLSNYNVNFQTLMIVITLWSFFHEIIFFLFF